MSEKIIDHVYVEVDVLFDVRFALIRRLANEETLLSILSAGYHDREIDQWPIDMEEYKRLYAKRDVDLLLESPMTAAIPLLQHLAATLKKDQVDNRPGSGGVDIVINAHPYDFTAEEIEELQKVMYVKMDGLATVSFVNMQTSELPPQYCLDHFKMMVMYDGLAWMESHHEAFRNVLLPKVMLLTPWRYMERVPTRDELKKLRWHPRVATELQASPLIELKMIEMKYFCAVKPQTT